MPYWLSLLADLLGRAGQRQRARSILDAAAASAEAHADVWWLPEVQRQRAMYDDHEPTSSRGSARPPHLAPVTAASRCSGAAEHDLAVRGVRPPAQRRTPGARARPRRERPANAPVPSLGPISTLGPKEHHHDHHIRRGRHRAVRRAGGRAARRPDHPLRPATTTRRERSTTP